MGGGDDYARPMSISLFGLLVVLFIHLFILPSHRWLTIPDVSTSHGAALMGWCPFVVCVKPYFLTLPYYTDVQESLQIDARKIINELWKRHCIPRSFVRNTMGSPIQW